MVGAHKVLALVPARGGSKSIPHKNLKLFAGHPLVAFSIAAGLQSNTVDRVIVSTDDPDIAQAAQLYGAEVPFMRPSELAQDDTPDFPVFEHALRWLEEKEGFRPDVVVQLRPTTPVRPPWTVTRAVEILLEHPDADSVRGVVPSGQTPYKMWRVDDAGRLSPLLDSDLPEPYNQPRQALPPTYWQTGHVDAIRLATLTQKHSMSGDVILPLLLDPSYTVDIDTQRDWVRAEELMLSGDLEAVWPGRRPRSLPQTVQAVVLDFDGVLTDDRVWVDQTGAEAVAAHRGDGWGISELKRSGIQVLILSSESNPVVAARAEKLDVPVVQGVSDKASALRSWLETVGIDGTQTVYVGNDMNDLGCFSIVGFACVVADAHPAVRRQADHVLTKPGGHGAVRELCDWILSRRAQRGSAEWQ
jgi:YrbI family 3-deoxy-D-manno-octulosonate 8-phosphate phosphatase